LEHIEVIDIENKEVLSDRWCKFTPTNHYSLIPTFNKSRIWRTPRRSSEALCIPMRQGIPCEDFPLPVTDNLIELQEYIINIARYE
jgi:hypothetical protein